jgi:hypothetical protein
LAEVARDNHWMKWSKQQRDERIEEVIVDAYGDAEQLGSFACVLDEMLDRPVAASVLGEPVELVAVSEDGDRLGLRAKCRRGGRTWHVALFDVTLGPDVDPDLDLTVAAYRQWLKDSDSRRLAGRGS